MVRLVLAAWLLTLVVRTLAQEDLCYFEGGRSKLSKSNLELC